MTYGVSNGNQYERWTTTDREPFVWHHFRESPENSMIYDYTKNIMVFNVDLRNMVQLNRLLASIHLQVHAPKWRDTSTVKCLVDLLCMERILVIMIKYLTEYNASFHVLTALNAIRTRVTERSEIAITIAEQARPILAGLGPRLYDYLYRELTKLGNKGFAHHPANKTPT